MTITHAYYHIIVIIIYSEEYYTERTAGTSYKVKPKV